MIDFDHMPIYEVQTMYYLLWKERDEESKMTEEEKNAKNLGRALEDSI